MFMSLFRLLPGRVWLIGALVAAVAGGWLWYRAEVASLESSLADAKSDATQYATEPDQWRDRAEQRKDQCEY